MNHLANLPALRNRYFALRHGKSEANELGMILSHPTSGVPKYGLTKKGRAQVRTSVETAKREGLLDANTVIITSDFKRARETAEITREVLGAAPIQLAERLRERSFGLHEKTSNANYAAVWADDATDATHRRHDVESVMDVLDRATSVVSEQERLHEGKAIILVSHGDTLQILQTAFAGVNGAQHRALPHLNTAEIRELILNQ